MFDQYISFNTRMDHFTEDQTFLDADTFRLSFDSEDEETPVEPWYSLLRNLTNDQIQFLHNIFKEKALKQKLTKSTESEGLSKEEFVAAIDETFGSGKYSVQAVLLYDTIDKEKEFQLNWTDFVNFLLEHLIPLPQTKLLLGATEISAVPHVKRETIVKIVLIETENYFCYAIISKQGHVGLYDGNTNFLTSYHAVMTIDDLQRNDEERKRRNKWITDAVFCRDALTLLIANNARNFAVYEASGMKHILLWVVLSLPNVVQCLWYCSNATDGGSVLFMGDDQGFMTSFSFVQPKSEMFRKRHNDKPSVYYWVELPAEKQHIKIRSHGRTHGDFIRQIQYISENGSIISCSRDRSVSLANKHILNRRKPYIFKVNRGVDCFSLSNSGKHIITGSSDGIVRIWDIVVPSRPVSVLPGHRSGIVDMQCYDELEVLITCSRDANIKVWDVRSYNCIQNVKMEYPVFNIPGKSIEWGVKSVYPGPKRALNTFGTSNADIFLIPRKPRTWARSHILVTCCNYIAKIKLTYPNDSEIDLEMEMPILPPPPLQNSVLIPSTWKIRDDVEIESNPTSSDQTIDEHIKSLSFILEKDLTTEFDCQDDINYKIAVLERKKLKMKENIARGAPYLALDLYEIENLTLPDDLPVPNKKSIQTLAEKTRKMLADAASRDQIFSEPSSSRSKSSRSSTVEFDI